MRYTGFTALTIGTLLSTGLLSLPSQGETPERQDQASRLMEELVVTARRREEGLQDAPLAVSAYSKETK
jgi:iron complex outermembrane receptor protein